MIEKQEIRDRLERIMPKLGRLAPGDTYIIYIEGDRIRMAKNGTINYSIAERRRQDCIVGYYDCMALESHVFADIVDHMEGLKL